MTNRLEQRCLDYGLHISRQRRIILHVLDEAEDHPSVEEIHKRAARHDSRLSIATVYRTINILAEWGLLSRIELGDGKGRYEEASDRRHEHLIDVHAGKVVELIDPAIQNLLHAVAQRCGYRLINYRLELFGEAHECMATGRSFKHPQPFSFRARRRGAKSPTALAQSARHQQPLVKFTGGSGLQGAVLCLKSDG